MNISSAALASLKAAAADCAAQASGFSPEEAAAGLLTADEPAREASGGPAPHTFTGHQAPLTLLKLLVEVLVVVLGWLDARSLAHFAATCSELYCGKVDFPFFPLRERLRRADEPRSMTPVEEALRQRASARDRFCPDCQPLDFLHLAGSASRLARAAPRRGVGTGGVLLREILLCGGGRPAHELWDWVFFRDARSSRARS